MTSYRDGFGNRVDLFNVATPYSELIIRATSYRPDPPPTGRVAARPRSAGPGDGPCGDRGRWSSSSRSPLVDRSPALDAFVGRARPRPPAARWPASSIADRAVREPADVREEGDHRADPAVSEALELGRGVCQDFAHLFIGACRGLGLPARYVSGYVNHPGEIATHAWCQVWAGDAPAGSTSTRPPAASSATTTSSPPSAATTPTSPPTAGSGRAGPRRRSPSPSRSSRSTGVPLEWNEWCLPDRRRTGQSQSQTDRAPGSRPAASGSPRPGRLPQPAAPPGRPPPAAGEQQQ